MRAQVNNPANGWNNIENAAQAESEPVDTTQIKGNYTHDDDATSRRARLRPHRPARDGERLQRLHRHLPRVPARRPLPQGADRLGTALERLHGDPSGDPRAGSSTTRRTSGRPTRHGGLASSPRSTADLAVNEQRGEALGQPGRRSAITAYEAGLPTTAADAAVAHGQPEDVERFDAAFFTWNGGSNYTDNPDVTCGARGRTRACGGIRRPVRRDPGDAGVPGGGEGAPPTSRATSCGTGPPASRPSSPAPRTADQHRRPGRVTPAGIYRFVVEGQRREGGAPDALHTHLRGVRGRALERHPGPGLQARGRRHDELRASAPPAPIRSRAPASGPGGADIRTRSGRSTTRTPTPTRRGSSATSAASPATRRRQRSSTSSGSASPAPGGPGSTSAPPTPTRCT